MKRILYILILCSVYANAKKTLVDEFDSLGGNKDLLKRAEALYPNQRISVVQKRTVDRRWRQEFAVEYGNILGGDAYLDTQSVGGQYNLHITPRISIGGRYQYYNNNLSPEGKNLIRGLGFVPDIDFPEQSFAGLINIYPFYGKFSLWGQSVVQFDFFIQGSYGVIDLESGRTNIWGAGGGMGIWWSKHISSRLEIQYENYLAKRLTEEVSLDLTTAKISMGILL